MQDIVETTLMSVGLYDVAKSYILYRDRRRSIRESKKLGILEKISNGQINIIKRDNKKEVFSEAKLKRFISRVCLGYEGVVDVDRITKQCELGIYNEIKSKDLSNLMIL